MTLTDEYLELAKRVNNWGRWGPDDQRGTLNFLDPEAVLRGVRCAKKGHAIPLGLRLWDRGPQTGALKGRINPIRTMTAINELLSSDPDGAAMSDDMVVMSAQGATHWDALAHVSCGGKLYNGFDASTVTTAGAGKLGVHTTGPIVGRGVLLDCARAAGVEHLAGGHALAAADLDAAASWGKVKIHPGDIVLVRTGHIGHLHAGDREAYLYTSPGLSMKTVEWFHEHQVSAVATDTVALEVFPCEDPDLLFPVHALHLVEMGLMQGQNFDLEALSEDCASDRTYEFLLEATPEPFVKGLGSPVNPVAVK